MIFLSLDTQKSKVQKRKDPAEDFLEMYCHPQTPSRDRNPEKTVFELMQEIKELKKENAELKEMVVQGICSYSQNNLSNHFSIASYPAITVLYCFLLGTDVK